MAPLFSKVDSNKLLLDVQYEVILICAKFGVYLFNFLKLQAVKQSGPVYFGLYAAGMVLYNVIV